MTSQVNSPPILSPWEPAGAEGLSRKQLISNSLCPCFFSKSQKPNLVCVYFESDFVKKALFENPPRSSYPVCSWGWIRLIPGRVFTLPLPVSASVYQCISISRTSNNSLRSPKHPICLDSLLTPYSILSAFSQY